MKEIKMNGYDTFRCIADRCSISCCEEWKISVDEESYQNWMTTDPAICEHVAGDRENRSMILDENHRCPFLNEEKLCKQVLRFGDEILSDTCTTFPRQIQEMDGVSEYTLVACCPEVVDGWRKEAPVTPKLLEQVREHTDLWLFEVREQMLKLVFDKRFPLSKRMMFAFYMLVSLKEDRNASVLKQFRQDEYLATLDETIDQMEFDTLATIFERNELFLDIIENYRSKGLYKNYLEEIAQQAELLEEEHDPEELEELSEAFLEAFDDYEELIARYLQAEIFTSLLTESSDLTDCMVAFEWMTMETVLIRHCIFLWWLQHGKEKIPYEVVRSYIVIIARMTGYDREDIREYLNNSFESLIWEWGYLALLTGRNL